MEEVVIPVSLFLTIGASLFGFRYLTNKERMAMIERGLDPVINTKSTKYFALKLGLLLLGAGLGLFIAYNLDNAVFTEAEKLNDNANVPLYFSMIGIFGGLGLLSSFFIEKRESAKDL